MAKQLTFWMVLVLVLTGCSYHESTNDYSLAEPDAAPGLYWCNSDGGTEGCNMDPNNRVIKEGWGNGGELITGDKGGKVALMANFTESRHGAGVYTVQFAVVPSGPTVAPDATATIFWRTAGNTITRKVSVGNGTSVTGVAESVEVWVQDTTLVSSPGQPYRVSITVAPGVRASRSAPPILRGIPTAVGPSTTPYIAILPPAGFTTVQIPQDAGAISADVEISAPSTSPAPLLTDVVVTQNDASNNLYKNYYPLIEVDFVPLYPSATQLLIFNNSATATVAVSVLFGIDG